jgi:hypothetical protein
MMVAIRLLRPTVVGLACDVGVPECITEVVDVFKNWITNTSPVQKPHPDLRSIVYSYGKYETCNKSSAFLFWLTVWPYCKIKSNQSSVSCLVPTWSNENRNTLCESFIERCENHMSPNNYTAAKAEKLYII